LGLMYSLFAVGSVLGAAWAGRSATRRRRGVRVYAGLTLVGLLTLAIGLLTTALGVGIVVLLLGGVLAVTNLTWTHVLQEYIPQEALGRVGSLNALGSNALLPIGFGLAGWATDSLGAPPVFIAGGLLTLGLAITGLLQPAVRRLD
jgi:MFS family permease